MLLANLLVVTTVLFGVIDIFGAIPLLDSLKEKRGVELNSLKISSLSLLIMLIFLFFGGSILNIVGLGVPEFAMVGSLLIFIMGAEMVLGIEIIKTKEGFVSDIFPAVFPIIAGAGTLSTIMSLGSSYSKLEILVGILLNIILVFVTIKNLTHIRKFLGEYGMATLRNIMGVVLLAISLKMFIVNLKFLL